MRSSNEREVVALKNSLVTHQSLDFVIWGLQLIESKPRKTFYKQRFETAFAARFGLSQRLVDSQMRWYTRSNKSTNVTSSNCFLSRLVVRILRCVYVLRELFMKTDKSSCFLRVGFPNKSQTRAWFASTRITNLNFKIKATSFAKLSQPIERLLSSASLLS